MTDRARHLVALYLDLGVAQDSLNDDQAAEPVDQ